MSASGFPEGFFDRMDASSDAAFYAPPRLVTHIDDTAIAAVSDLYAELGVDGEVLDLMSSWVSHLPRRPRRLTVLGMNRTELEANPMADEVVVHDLNDDPPLPFEDGAFDAVLCCVSVDYLTQPLAVFGEVRRVLRPDAPFVCTFSNRVFPTKAIQGWLTADESTRCAIVAEYFRRSSGWSEPHIEARIPPGGPTDPLYAVHARRARRA